MYIVEAATTAITAGAVTAVAPGLLRKLKTARTPKPPLAPDQIHER